MKLKTIKKTKTNSIILVDNEYWGILPDKILQYFCKGQPTDFDLSEEGSAKLLDEIKKVSWNKLLDYFAYQERSIAECKEYLSYKLLLKTELQSELLQKAISLNFVDDTRFAEMFTDELIRKSKSQVEIKNKLFAKKIDKKIITDILQTKFNPQTANEILEINIEKAKIKFSRFSEKDRKEKILNYLTRKGFAYWKVKDKLED
jgi:SOS response regulatory protein OraA/RecX